MAGWGTALCRDAATEDAQGTAGPLAGEHPGCHARPPIPPGRPLRQWKRAKAAASRTQSKTLREVGRQPASPDPVALLSPPFVVSVLFVVNNLTLFLFHLR